MTASPDPAVQVIADAVHRMVFGSERGNDGIPDSEDVRWAQQIAAALRAAGYPLNPDEVSVPRAEIEALRAAISSSNSGPAAPCFDEFDYAVERSRGSWYAMDAPAVDAILARLDPSTKETR